MNAAEHQKLALELAQVCNAMDSVNVDLLALHVAIANMNGEKSRASVRAKFILTTVVQWKALERHLEGRE
jgi:hypothetical protein